MTLPVESMPASASPPAGTLTVSQLHTCLDDALGAAGLVQVWVTFPCMAVSRAHACVACKADGPHPSTMASHVGGPSTLPLSTALLGRVTAARSARHKLMSSATTAATVTAWACTRGEDARPLLYVLNTHSDLPALVWSTG